MARQERRRDEHPYQPDPKTRIIEIGILILTGLVLAKLVIMEVREVLALF
jgi:hypothetical protein